jgi:hypothetical protein
MDMGVFPIAASPTKALSLSLSLSLFFFSVRLSLRPWVFSLVREAPDGLMMTASVYFF